MMNKVASFQENHQFDNHLEFSALSDIYKKNNRVEEYILIHK